MPRKKYNKSPIVPDRMIPLLESRSIAALAKRGIEPTQTAIPLFGTKHYTDDAKTYITRIRPFVNFLLCNPQYDDSLPIFYPYTPKGAVTVQDAAVSHFLLNKGGVAGAPLIDMEGKKVLNLNKVETKCIGGWACEENFDGLRSSLTCIHANAHGLKADYKEHCPKCENI